MKKLNECRSLHQELVSVDHRARGLWLNRLKVQEIIYWYCDQEGQLKLQVREWKNIAMIIRGMSYQIFAI